MQYFREATEEVARATGEVARATEVARAMEEAREATEEAREAGASGEDKLDDQSKYGAWTTTPHLSTAHPPLQNARLKIHNKPNQYLTPSDSI